MRRPSRLPRNAVLLVALAAAACPAEREQSRVPPESPAATGTIRLGYPEEPPSLNPLTDRSPATLDLLRPVLPSFHIVTPDLRYEPYLLAEEPEVDRGGGRMTVRFRIRDDAAWSDGRPITVGDVAFTWRATTGLDEVVRTHGFDRLVAVEEESARVGRLILRPPLASWRDLFSAGRFVLPAHAAERLHDVLGWNGGPPVTAGPFRLGRWTRGRSVTLVPDARFWAGPPAVDGIEVAFVPDPTTALQLLERGMLDAVAPMAGVSWGRRLDAVEGVSVSEAFGPTFIDLVLNTDSIPSPEIRRGIVDAIDRDRLVEVALRDEAVPADGVVVPEETGAGAAWSRFGHGEPRLVPVPEELDLVYVRAERTDLVARYLQAELERAGVDLELVALESDVFHGTFVPSGRYDLAIWEARMGPTPELWPWIELPDAGEPLTGLTDQDVAGQAMSARRGGPEVDEAWREAQRGLADLAPVLPLFRPEVTVGWRPGVSGLEANPTVEGPLWNAGAWTLSAA